MSAAVFHKDIKNEILTVSQTETQMIGGSQVVVTTKQPINASKSGVDGIELNFVYSRFDFLPGAWSGLGVSINGTFLNEHPNELTMNDGSIRKLPAMVEAAKQTINASLHYNYGPFGAKLAYNHTSQILWTVATDSPVNDLYYAPKDVYDLQATYDVNDHLTLIAQGKNLTNSRPSRMFGLSQELLREELDNGKSYWLGLKFKY